MARVPTYFGIKSMKNMKIGLKWVHMARYGLILRLEGALWLTIIFKPLLTQKRANNASFLQWEVHYQNPLYEQKAHAHIKGRTVNINNEKFPCDLGALGGDWIWI